MALTADQRDAWHQKIIKWTREGLPNKHSNFSDTYTHEDVVWWGYFDKCGDDEVHPPAALFPLKEQAEAFATLMDKGHDWCVAPCVLKIESRDNFDVPES